MKTKRTTIAAVAHNYSTGDSDKNLALMEEVLAGGETSETDIYVFPELNISGGVIKTDLVNLGRNSSRRLPCGGSLYLGEEIPNSHLRWTS